MSAIINLDPRHDPAGPSGIVLTCNARDHELAKRIPGGRYRDGEWHYPLAFTTCMAARAEFGQELTVGEELNAWAGGYLTWRATAMQRPFPSLYGPAFDTGELDEDGEPIIEKAHQVEGGDWLAYVGRGLLLDPMRLGKTISVLRALRNRGITNFILIAPNTSLWKWAAEIRRWHPEAAALGITIVKGTPTKKAALIAAAKGPVVINWEGIRSLSRLAPYGSIELTEKQRQDGPLNLHPFDAIVADEVHRAVDPHAQQTRAYWTLMHATPIRFGLSGTVLTNGPADPWAVMHGIAPHEYPVRSHYLERYTMSGQGRYGYETWGWSLQHRDELFFVWDARALRRTPDEAGVIMPDKLPPEVRGVEMEGPQRKAYDALKKELALADSTELLIVKNPLELATRLIQASAGVPILGRKTVRVDDQEVEVVTVEALKMPSVKVTALLEILEEAAGDPTIVFSESKLLVNLAEVELKKAGYGVVRITGDEHPAQRQENIEAFQDGRAQVVLCTYAAASESITLSRGRILVRLQRPRSMVHFVQASARGDAMGKPDPVQLVDVFTLDSIESRVWDAVDVKDGYLQDLLRDELRTAK